MPTVASISDPFVHIPIFEEAETEIKTSSRNEHRFVHSTLVPRAIELRRLPDAAIFQIHYLVNEPLGEFLSVQNNEVNVSTGKHTGKIIEVKIPDGSGDKVSLLKGLVLFLKGHIPQRRVQTEKNYILVASALERVIDDIESNRTLKSFFEGTQS